MWSVVARVEEFYTLLYQHQNFETFKVVKNEFFVHVILVHGS